MGRAGPKAPSSGGAPFPVRDLNSALRPKPRLNLPLRPHVNANWALKCFAQLRWRPKI